MTLIEIALPVLGIVLLSGLTWLMRRRRGRFGPAAVGMLEPFTLHAQRQSVEVIVEGRAAVRDPEDKDGNLPDLSGPKP